MRRILVAAVLVMGFPAAALGASCTVGASKCVRERMEYCEFCYGAVAGQQPCWKRSSRLYTACILSPFQSATGAPSKINK